MTPSSFAKSVGFARRQVRYAKPSARQVGGASGRCGQCADADDDDDDDDINLRPRDLPKGIRTC